MLLNEFVRIHVVSELYYYYYYFAFSDVCGFWWIITLTLMANPE